jgi:hypothetical protein
MKTEDEIKKIEAVVLYILRQFHDGVDYIKLFKIMYFAQKDFLLSYGKVLCPDTFKARKYGPVPMLSDKVIKTVETREPLRGKADLRAFARSIRVDTNQHVFALHEPDTDYLSVKEREYLDKWIDNCREKDSLKELSPESHDQAYETAWQAYQDDPQKGEMTLIEIARAGGASEKMVAYIREKELMAEELS